MALVIDKWIKQGEGLGRKEGSLDGMEKGLAKGLEFEIDTLL